VATAHGRQGWRRAARQRLDHERAQRAKPIPRSRPERLLEARRRLEEDLAVESAANPNYEAYRRRGVMRDRRRMSARPKPYTPPEVHDGKVNVTDPDSKLVHGMRGWIQGYNAQAVCNEQHLIVAAEVMTASPDFGHLAPMLTAARRELTAAGVTEPPHVVVADAGYWHLEQMNEITGLGVPVLIPPDSSRRTNTRPGWNVGAYDFMRSVLATVRSVLATDRGSALYKQRAQLIEPIFGNTKHNRGFTRFARRGRAAAQTEWRLMATTHNLLKLHQRFSAAAE
jgi:DDE family transposase